MLNKGYYNEYQQFVPQKPQFSFKDKRGLIKPKNLSLEGIYKLSSCTYQGKVTYPVDPNKPNCEFDPRFNVSYYILFFDSGRAFTFSTPTFLEDGSLYQLNADDLNEKKAFASKDYWYADSNANDLQIETFISANGQGRYMISDATVEYGKLILPEKNGHFTDASTYSLMPLDKSILEDFNVDW